MPRIVTVSAPSRLHFGLFAFGAVGRQFGGVGAMVAEPRLRLEITQAAALEVAGPLAERAMEFARRWSERNHDIKLPACRVQIIETPAEHTGLGTGTQLGLAVAAGLNAFHDLPAAGPLELAASVGRGLRSAVGTYGFLQGGLIAERGKLPHEALSPLDLRVDLPGHWRFTLFQPQTAPGLAGGEEEQALAALPPVPMHTTETLIRIAQDELFPAAAQADFAEFSDSLFRYGTLAGQCYAARQGGPFNGSLLTKLVETLRAQGVIGIGQSSWGPTIFAVHSDEDAAARCVRQFERAWPEPVAVNCQITPPDNEGAAIIVRT